MSFANLKKASRESIQALTNKLTQDSSNKSFADDRFWKLTVDKVGNGFAVIRFLPATDTYDIPYVKTYNHGFKVDSRWLIEECPTTMGQPCPICDANSDLWNSGIESNKAIVRERKRKVQYIANIYIVSDPKNPAMEGKVMLFQFGKKIFDKITQALTPEFEDEVAFNPFDFWEGANFKLKCRNVDDQRTYDKSEFESISPLFDDDSKMEEVWKKEFDLSEFVSQPRFKTYDELKKKFDFVLHGNTITSPTSEDKELDFDTPLKSTSQPIKNTLPQGDQPPAEDDEMAAYYKFLQED